MLNIKEIWINNVWKYIVMTAWLSVCVMLFWTTYDQFRYEPQYYYVHKLLGSWLCLSRGSAAVLNLNCGLLLLPMCKTTVTCLRKVQNLINSGTLNQLFNACKGFHITVAYSIIVLSVVHLIGHVFNARNYSINYNWKYKEANAARFQYEGPMWIMLRTVPGVTGLLMMIILIMFIPTSIRYFRVHHYNLFWYSHRLFLVFYLLFIIHPFSGPIKVQTNLAKHTPGCNTSLPFTENLNNSDEVVVCEEQPTFQHIGCKSWLWISVPLMIYLVDSMYRLFNRSQKGKVVFVQRHLNDVLEVLIHKRKFYFKSGQYSLIQFPELSTVEWHPFTMIKNQGLSKDIFSVYIKNTGDWTDASITCLNRKVGAENQRPIDVYIDGPFHSPLEDIFQYPVSLCIAGGIGITPFISHIRNMRTFNFINNIRLYLVWINRDILLFSLFKEDLETLHHKCFEKNLLDFFDTRLFVTGSKYLTLQNFEAMGMFIMKRLHVGRPQWKSIFQDLSRSHPRTNIGVYVCGPRRMIQDVQQTCNNLPCSTSKFYFHKESF